MKLTDIRIIENDYPAKAELSKISCENGICIYKLTVSSEQQFTPLPLCIEFNAVMGNALSFWSPRIGFTRYIAPNWRKTKTESKIAIGAPVMSMINADGSNALTVALSDPKTPTEIARVSAKKVHLWNAVLRFSLPLSAQLPNTKHT